MASIRYAVYAVYAVYTIWIHQGIGEQRISYDFMVLFGTHTLSLLSTEILSITLHHDMIL